MTNCNHPYEAVESVNIEAVSRISGKELTVNSKRADICGECGEVLKTFSKNEHEDSFIKVGRENVGRGKTGGCSHEESGGTVSEGEIIVQTVGESQTIQTVPIPVCEGCGFPPEEFIISLN